MGLEIDDIIYPERMEIWNNVVERSKTNLIMKNTISILEIALKKLEEGKDSFKDVEKEIEGWIKEYGYSGMEYSNVIEGILHLSKVGPEFCCWFLDGNPNKNHQKDIIETLKQNKKYEKLHPSDTKRNEEVLSHRKTIEEWQKAQDIEI